MTLAMPHYVKEVEEEDPVKSKWDDASKQCKM
jgi:hypothetical protein